eukprot:5755436-Pyramimonas_sp.AAC.1
MRRRGGEGKRMEGVCGEGREDCACAEIHRNFTRGSEGADCTPAQTLATPRIGVLIRAQSWLLQRAYALILGPDRFGQD